MNLEEVNVWFDSLKEPYRFKVFIVAMVGWLVPLCIGDALVADNEVIGGTLRIIGSCWLFAVCIIALDRAFGIRK